MLDEEMVTDASDVPDDAAWQAAHDSAQALSVLYNNNYNKAKTDDQRAVMDQLADQAFATLTLLNQQDMASRTGAIDAAIGPVNDAIDKLTSLETDLKKVSAGFEEAVTVCEGIDKAMKDLSAFIAV